MRTFFILIANLWTAVRLVLTSPLALVRMFRPQPRTFVRLDLQGSLPYGAPQGLARLVSSERTFLQLREDINLIRDDPKIAGVVIQPEELGAPHARRRDVEELLHGLRKADKEVHAHVSTVTSSEYQFAAVATRLSITPSGRFYTFPPRRENHYLAGAFERFGVVAQFIQLGRFKAAASMFLRTGASEAEREMFTRLEDDLARGYLDAVRNNRALEDAALRQLHAAPLSSRIALREGLVDEISATSDPSYSTVAHDAYARRRRRRLFRSLRRTARVAVVELSGMIVDRKLGGGGAVIEVGRVVALLKRLTSDPSVAGVLLCINSPGGSAIGSDEIFQAVTLLAAEKPVVAYCQDVAASGGYYIACAADTVVCQLSSIVGSIGVIAGKISVGRALDKVGVSHEAFGEGSAFLSPTEPLDEATMARLRADARDMYRRFLQCVGEMRGLDKRRLHRLARGRVYLGADAKARGLVDLVGGFETAVDALARCVGGIVELVGYSTHAPSLRGVLASQIGGTRVVFDAHRVMHLLQHEPIVALYCGPLNRESI